MGRKKVNLSTVLAGQYVGIFQKDDNIWLVSFMNYELGYFDLEACRVEPSLLRTPLTLKCYLCVRYKLLPMCPERTQ